MHPRMIKKRGFYSKHMPQARFSMQKNALQARLIKRNASQARFFWRIPDRYSVLLIWYVIRFPQISSESFSFNELIHELIHEYINNELIFGQSTLRLFSNPELHWYIELLCRCIELFCRNIGLFREWYGVATIYRLPKIFLQISPSEMYVCRRLQSIWGDILSLSLSPSISLSLSVVLSFPLSLFNPYCM